MGKQEVLELVWNNYKISPIKIEKIKNIYKISDNERTYALKIIPYSKERLNFILGGYNHLINNGFECILPIIKTKNGEDYIAFDKGFAYLNEFIDYNIASYDNPIELSIAAITLGKLHKFSNGFKIENNMDVRALWGMWPLFFKDKERDILGFKKEIEGKKNKTDFDLCYLSLIKEEVYNIERSLETIIRSQYENLMKEEVLKEGFCHHDYAHHNILLNKEGNVKIIDFDYLILDSHLHDLASLITRKMRYNLWSIEDALFILDNYNEEYKIKKEEILVMAGFMEFPQEFWQVGIQYYIEKQPWGEEFFNKKIEKIYQDIEGKYYFLNKFKRIYYSGGE